jgi:hypothetical protein
MNTIILACNGWGKTYLSKKFPDTFIDGDTVVPWPYRPSWRTKQRVGDIPDPFEVVRALEDLDTKGRVILFCPTLDVYDYLCPSALQLYYSEISTTRLARNLVKRQLEEKREDDSDDLENVLPKHDLMGRWARHNRLRQIDRDYLMKGPPFVL